MLLSHSLIKLMSNGKMKIPQSYAESPEIKFLLTGVESLLTSPLPSEIFNDSNIKNSAVRAQIAQVKKSVYYQTAAVNDQKQKTPSSSSKQKPESRRKSIFNELKAEKD